MMPTLFHHTVQGDASRRGFVEFHLGPDVALEDFMIEVRYLFDVQGEAREYKRTPDGVIYHVPVLPKGEL